MAAVWIACSCSFGQAVAQQALRLAHPFPPNSSQHKAAEYFAKATTGRSSSGLRIEIFPSSALVSEAQLVQMVQNEILDLALVQSSLGRIVEPFRIFDLPYLVRNRRHVQILNEQLVPEMAGKSRASRIEVLTILDGGFRQVSSRRPIEHPSAMKGLRIRTVASTPIAYFFQELGASPVSIPFSETVPAISAGLVDAADLPLEAIVEFSRQPGRLPFITITNHAYTCVYLIASSRLAQKLDAKTWADIRNAAQEASAFSMKEGELADSQYRTQLETSGVKVIGLSDRSSQTFVDQSRGTYDRFAKELRDGPEFIFQALRLVPHGR